MDPSWDELAHEPAVRAAVEVAAELAAAAAQTEAAGVDRPTLDRIAARGLHGLHADPEQGGAGTPVRRRVEELLAGADPQVWFVWFQHNPVVAMLAGSENAALARRWLPALTTGRAYAGVAFSHLRSPAPSVHARRVDDGWLLAGRQPWCTGWGLIDAVLVGAVTGAGEVLFALVPAAPGNGLTSTGELPLAAMGATRTVGLTVDALPVPDADVVLRMPYADWRAADLGRNANVQPATFGIALAALELLDDRAPALATELCAAVLDTRRACYRLLDEAEPGEQVPRRLELRARALLQGMQAATALVASRGGAAFSLADHAQRLLRAAAHQLVHSQDQPVREATLQRIEALPATA